MRCNVEVDAKKTLETCEEKGQPFCYWNLKEFDELPGLSLPNLNKDGTGYKQPEGWESFVPHRWHVDLDNVDQVEVVKGAMRSLIDLHENTTKEIGFAVVAKEGNLTVIQAYIQ